MILLFNKLNVGYGVHISDLNVAFAFITHTEIHSPIDKATSSFRNMVTVFFTVSVPEHTRTESLTIHHHLHWSHSCSQTKTVAELTAELTKP